MDTIDTTPLQDAVEAIYRITDEAELEKLHDVLRSRRKQMQTSLAHQNLSTLRVGDHVELFGLSPKYVNGTRGLVTHFDRDKILVTLDQGTNPRVTARFGRSIRVPAASMKKVQ
jgi:hypothetical protein